MREETTGEDPPYKGATWAEHNRDAAEGSPYEIVEHYPAGDTATLAMRLHRDGLIYRINREILHPLGLAIGVAGKLDREAMLMTEIHSITLHDTGGEPIEYTAEQIEWNERKLHAAD